MNILLVGDLTSLAIPLANGLAAERHKVIIAGAEPPSPKQSGKAFTFHTVDPADPLFEDAMASYRFDAVIFLTSREELADQSGGMDSRRLTSSLLSSLSLAVQASVKRFFLISSTEIYGDAVAPDEKDEALPASLNGKILQTFENYCRYYQDHFGVNTTILRVPYMVGEQEQRGLLADILSQVEANQEALLPVSQNDILGFLHVNDLTDFILAALDDSAAKLPLVVLPAPDPMTGTQLTALINQIRPQAKFAWSTDFPRYTRHAEGEIAHSTFRWFARHTLASELPGLISTIEAKARQKPSWWTRFKKSWLGNQQFTRWIELAIGVAVVQWLDSLTGTLLQFRYVDFRLLFVVLMGSVHGTLTGLIAAFLAAVSAVFAWQKTGQDWNLLIYNIENWIPFALYLLAGGITGYLHDRNENENRFQSQQLALMHEKYQFLYGLYSDITAIKDQFREQLMGYRDSFGRIYNVTRELDTLQEADVIFKALSILEDVMTNDKIAIYTLDSHHPFARLQASSRSITDEISKSLNLDQFPELKRSISENAIFQNSALLAGYPAYFAPIFNEGVPVAAVAIWQVRFEQYSLSYLNLFQVLCGLVQSSLVRATLFSDINLDRMYIPGTRILQTEAFDQVLSVKNRMRDTGIADCRLLRVHSTGESHQDMFAQIAKGIRAVDYVGIADHPGEYNILLSQTDSLNAQRVIDRLEKMNIKAELLGEDLVHDG